jgi:2-polyprenyl-3-methyl-5-hydroxy-6-metoxy-1,4-benzoquinol methylase
MPQTEQEGRRRAANMLFLPARGSLMTTVNFAQRSMQPELMDSETVDFAEFHQCLRQLTIVNVLTLAYRPTLRWLGRTVRYTMPHDTVSVLDVGFGGGDMLRKIWKLLQRRGLKAELTGVDLNPWSKQSAEEDTPQEMNIRFDTSNVFSLDPVRQADFIISCNFTHHLTDAELVRFIKWMDSHAVRGWFINDLHRHPLPYYFVKTVFHLLPLSRMMRSDGPISISRAFVAADWRRLLAEAGIPRTRTSIKWFFPFRYVVACRKA